MNKDIDVKRERRLTFADIDAMESNEGTNKTSREERNYDSQARQQAIRKSNHRMDKLAQSTERQPSIRRLQQVISSRAAKLKQGKVDSALAAKATSYLPSTGDKQKTLPGMINSEQNNEDIMALLTPGPTKWKMGEQINAKKWAQKKEKNENDK